MTSYQMTLTKSAYNGWNADTVIPMGSVEITSLGEKKLCRRVLEISTSKRRPGLISSFASVSTIEDRTSSDGKSYSMKTMEIFSGYATSALARSFPLALPWSYTVEERDWEWKRGAGVPRSSAVGVL